MTREAATVREGSASSPLVAQASSLQSIPPLVAQASSLQSIPPLVAQASSLQSPENPLTTGTHSRGYLPHWKREGAAFFVTFRLAGTLPRKLLERLQAEEAEAQQRDRARAATDPTAEPQARTSALSEAVDAWLDLGEGETWLRDCRVAEVVAGALRHFDGERYDLHAWVIMPNHVHALVTPRGAFTLSAILHSWKSFTANRANQILGRAGEFWQRESYDHLIRDQSDFSHAWGYIRENPVKARLVARPEEWAYLWLGG